VKSWIANTIYLTLSKHNNKRLIDSNGGGTQKNMRKMQDQKRYNEFLEKQV
jgi:hypothetical protein